MDNLTISNRSLRKWSLRKWSARAQSRHGGIAALILLLFAATMATLAAASAAASVPHTVGGGAQDAVCVQQVRFPKRSGWSSSSSSRRARVTTMCEMGKREAPPAVQPILFEGAQDPPTVVSAPNRRIVAIGDLHGDIERTQWALQLAGVLSKDGQHRWTGGTTVLVQVGDVLDRGQDEIAILSLLASLGKQARSKGGAAFQILGNHETMNVAGDFRYVAPGGFQEAEAFAEYCEEDHGGNWDAAFEEWHRASHEFRKSRSMDFTDWLPIFNPIKNQKGVLARVKLLSPGGPLATQLAAHGVVLKVNDWLFAHGGVLPHHVDYGLERINKEVSLWMKMGNNRWGQPAQMPFVAVKGFDSIVWSRLYSKENFDRAQERIQACGILSAALAATKCRGLIVGHTPQTIGANCKCDGRIWRIDVGMSSGVLHALPEVLEIVDDKVRILSVAEEFLQEDEESVEQEVGWNDRMEVQNYRT